MIVAVGRMGERRGGPDTARRGGFVEGRGAERYEVTESRQTGPGYGVYRNQFKVGRFSFLKIKMVIKLLFRQNLQKQLKKPLAVRH